MDFQIGWSAVWHKSLRRGVNLMLTVVLLTQPGCMCGCSSPQRTACLSSECDGSGSLCDAHATIGVQSPKELDSDMDGANDDDSP